MKLTTSLHLSRG